MGTFSDLSASLQSIKGVGPRLAELFSKKGIDTLEDALFFVPRAYEDRRRITSLNRVVPNQTATFLAKVVSSAEQRKGRQSRFQAVVSDGTGSLMLTWFRSQPYLKQDFVAGRTCLVYGEVKLFMGRPSISHPEYEMIQLEPGQKPRPTQNFGRVIPIYSETEGLHQKTIRKVMGEALRASLASLNDALPLDLRDRLSLPSLRDSFVSVHFPNDFPAEEGLSPALKRIIFEEFFVLQLGLGLKKQRNRAERSLPMVDRTGLSDRFLASLPFQLTPDQAKTFEEIRTDLGQSKSMTRLVQGDVGSGKTVVALASAAIAVSDGFQACLMAPTEILAAQHYKTALQHLGPLGVSVSLLVQTPGDRKPVEAAISNGTSHLIIGTHAVFQQNVEFKRLGLVIVDEQHRFGVEQRSELLRKGSSMPHLLMMTATPIPRTLALTLYGDLDLSFIRQKPAGRLPITTRIVRDRERPRIYSKIRETVGRGEQVYIIYPLVDVSEKLDLKSATEMYAHLSKEIFPELSVALVHGRMKGEEKDRILADYKAKKYQILISTTVIEVGIDVPNATLMVIEHPERLGLSQLHQLRGRVGRGSASSECWLVAENFVGPRLRVMESTEDGFEIAEEDLKIRGPGEFLGTRQSGLPGFRVGHILRDAELLTIARREAERLLEIDPKLDLEAHRGIRHMVESRWKDKIERLLGG
jgi:ATP-dependent DNA helicase RecG